MPLGRTFAGRALGATAAFACVIVSVAAQAPVLSQEQTRPGYDLNFIGPPLSDSLMQHAKETFVLYGCAYCHGVTLIARGEAADLMHSALVGADVGGNMIVPLLKAGIPQTAKLSPMPQFSDLSDQQLHEIATYIHYARQQGRYKELVREPPTAGDAVAGKAFFDASCSVCHARDLVAIGRKYDATKLRQEMLDPTALQAPLTFGMSDQHNAQARAARDRHHALLENYTTAQVANLMAYLATR